MISLVSRSINFAPRPRRRPGRRLAAAAAVLAGSLFVAAAPSARVEAAADPSAPVAQIALNRAVYDRYDPVIIELGAIGYFPSCPGGGVRDYINAWADIYIIRGLTAGGLVDVSGQPNAVIGFGGGGFFDEVIGYAGLGGLNVGTYSVVVDECQDGRLDANDTVYPNLFRVTARTSVSPMLGIASLKVNAGKRADEWAARGRDWKILLAMNEALQYVTPFLTNPPLVAIGIGISQFVSAQISSLATGAFPDPKEIAATQYTEMSRHYRGIESDPPDPDYARMTSLETATVFGAVYPDPIFASAAAISRGTAAEEVLTEGLLHSIERYQGAAAQGDGSWALVHARQAQEFARLLSNQLATTAGVYEAAALAIETDPRPIDDTLNAMGAAYSSIFGSGITAEQEALLVRSGANRAGVTQKLADLWRLDFGTADVASIAATLRSLATSATAFAADLDGFAAANQSVIDGLASDPFAPGLTPVVDAGGPYSTTVGAPVTLTATATGPSAISSFAWDTDGDGAFDDGDGASISTTPQIARVGLVGVQVTDADGGTGVGYAAIEVTGDSSPVEVSSSPADSGIDVAVGSSQAFSFVASTGAPVWFVDGLEAATGNDFTYTPSAAGTHRVRATVSVGTGVARDWTVYAVFPDVDGDGYPSDKDCDDNDPATHPGAPELADPKDNDCDPATSSTGVVPTLSDIVPAAGPEGVELTVTAKVSPSGGTATIDWGDGTVTAATVAGANVTGKHVYADDRVHPVLICVRSVAAKVACAPTTASVSNVAATPDFVDLFGWTDEGNTIDSDQGPAQWVVAADGRSVLQVQNSDPGFFVSDTPLNGTEAQISIRVESDNDDDFMGFAVGVVPGFTTNTAARYLLVDWKKGTQYYACGSKPGYIGLAVSYVEGVVKDSELWAHDDCSPSTPGKATELARATTYGSTGWVTGTSYLFRIVYTATRLQVYVNDVLQIDVANDLINGGDPSITFPSGNLAFYNFSQDGVRYSAYTATALAATEGTPATIPAHFIDPGTADTHIGRFDFGDGTATEAAVIVESNGAGDATTSHTYAQDGDYPAELCITDDDDGTGCRAITMRVANAAPVVDAGRDRDGGPTVALDDTSFTDPGILDTHTATVDWGDGTPVVAGTTTSLLGRGTVAASHTYTVDGAHTVTVCVTDDANATGCDTFTVTAAATNVAPVASIAATASVPEGTEVEQGVAFTDTNTSDTLSAIVDWGDGSSSAAVVQARPGAGSGAVRHTYADNGAFAATLTACDPGPLCHTAGSTITVTNVDPAVTVAVSPVAGDPFGAAAVAPFTDPGAGDTHSATLDWGDGAVTQAVIDAGRALGQHSYATGGDHLVAACVTDDDGARTCATAVVSLAPGAATTTSTSPPASTSTTQPSEPGTTTPTTTPTTPTTPGTEPTPTTSVSQVQPPVPETTVFEPMTVPGGFVLPSTGSAGLDVILTTASLLLLAGWLIRRLDVRLRRR